MKTASILGVQFHAVTKQQAVELAMSKLRARQKGYVVTPNPEIVDLCRRDPEFMGIVNHAALVLPDGIGIIYAAKILGEGLPGRVPGIEFAEELCAAMAKENMRLSARCQTGYRRRPARTCARNFRDSCLPARMTATSRTRSRS